MAGTTSNRAEELARINRSESNTYESGRTDSGSKYNPGFTKSRSPKDPNNTVSGTKGPNGGPSR